MSAPWRVALGCDDAGFEYKQAIKADLLASPLVASVVDVGVDADGHTDYPEIAVAAAHAVADGSVDRAILVCGTGLGMAIAANKIAGVRAATVHDSFSAERSVMSNDAQVITLGQRVIGLELARRIVTEWLTYRFDPASPSARKISLISGYEGESARSRRATRHL